eukprot:13006778-Heterocapsa_arctica.AAC.1
MQRPPDRWAGSCRLEVVEETFAWRRSARRCMVEAIGGLWSCDQWVKHCRPPPIVADRNGSQGLRGPVHT